MSLKLNSSGGGSVTLQEPVTASDLTLNLPTSSGTVVLDGGSPTFSALTVNGNNISAVNSMGFRNRIINGEMTIDQRNNGASVTPSATALYTYLVDRWAYNPTQASKMTWGQNLNSVTPPVGYTNYLGGQVGASANVTVGSSDYFFLRQVVEGLNLSDLSWGTANAQTITLSFWVRSSLTGTFGGTLENSALNRGYPFSYVISAANTWEQKFLTIVGDTTGTWLTNIGTGVDVRFGLGAGTTFQGTAGSWQAINTVSATGAVNLISTNGATFYITGVQLEAGTVATPFERIDYGRELIMCQRYFQRLVATETYSVATGMSVGSNSPWYPFFFPVVMRAAPTCTFTGTAADYWVQWSAGTSTPSSFPTWTASSGKGGYFLIPGSYGMSAGATTIFLLNNSTLTGGMLWSAEL